jgi:hypothetical protein
MSKHKPKNKEFREEDTLFNEFETEDDVQYSQEIINEMVDESIYQACSHTASYVQTYQKENSLPFAEFLNFGCISDFILQTGQAK